MQPFFRVDSLSNVKRFPFFITLSFIAINSLYSQNGSSWIFGDGVDITFTDTGIVQRRSDFYSYESSAIYITGNDTFLSNGEILYLNNDSIKPLPGNSSSAQGTVFFESNSDSIINFIISGDVFDNPLNHYFATYKKGIDKLQVNTILKNGREQVAVVNHQNNNGTWLCFHENKTSNYYFFYYSNDGLLCCPNKLNRGYNYGNTTNFWGTGSVIKFAPNGRLIGNNVHDSRLEVFEFNSELGSLGDSSVITGFNIFTFCFSKNANNIYPVSNQLWQVSIEHTSSGINTGFANRIAPTDIGWNNSYGQISLGYDNKIYLAKIDSSHLAVIDNPEEYFNDLIFLEKGLPLTYGQSQRGLPNFNASYFYTPSIDFAYTEDCWEHTYSFEGRDTFDADGYKWIFEKVNSSELSVISGKNCVFTFPDTGKWEVSHIAWNTSRSDTVTKTLTIRPQWQQNMLGKDTFYCKGDSKGIALTAPSDMHCVHWNGEEPNLDSALGKIIDYDHFHSDTLLVDTAGTYIVKLTNKTFCQAWDTITISEYPTPSKSGISRFKDSIVSNTVAQTYRWYRDGVPQLETDDRRLKPTGNGYWQVQLVSEFGCESELSDSLLVGFASLPSIKATNSLSFKVYPNPSDGNISIELSHTEYFGYAQHRLRRSVNGSYAITVSDLNGKLIYSTKQNLSLNFKLAFAFASGNYIVTLINENGETGSKQITVR
jgi:hypothetical protein